MGIGSSSGAFYEDERDRILGRGLGQDGLPFAPKGDEGMVQRPPGTQDKNEIGPDEQTMPRSDKMLRVSNSSEDNFYDGSTPNQRVRGAFNTLEDYKYDELLKKLPELDTYKADPPKTIEDLLEGKSKYGRYSEDEPGPGEDLRRVLKGPLEGDDAMAKKPSDILGIDPTNDHSIYPYDILYKSPTLLQKAAMNDSMRTGKSPEIQTGPAFGGSAYTGPVNSTPTQMKIRLDQLLRDKAATKKAGGDVESSDYMHYNTQIRDLRSKLKDLSQQSE